MRVPDGPVAPTSATASGSDPSQVPATDRVAPRCRHAGNCGGCDWQHLSYSAQLRLKRARVAETLISALGAVGVPVSPAVGAPVADNAVVAMPWGFRRKVHFVFAQRGPTLVMGHYRRGSREVLPIDECPVHPDRANALAFVVRDALQKARVAAGPDGVVKHLVIRVSASRNEMLATLVVSRNDPSRLKRVMRDVMASQHAPTGWFLNIHPRPNALLFGDETLRLAGRDRLRDDIGGTGHLVSPDAFFQTNVEAAAALVQRVLDAVPGHTAAVLDLYAGAGLFALPLARRGVQVIAIEENAAAVADGEASRALNRIGTERCRFLVARAEDALARNVVRDARAEVVVLDPPRTGAGEVVMHMLRDGIAPARLVYVSCDPDALARDLAVVCGPGGAYAIASISPIDMFPHTPHVETLVVLDRCERGARARPPRRGVA